ncbi:septal ring lytic transglycosylase RlpA family protein [Denitromonas ohlonensis]|uniref:Endolytic peptidoglycan transglycosylase RlpA n=2 Tax=Denitromonas TaxID=139331 RepID=A0A557RR40_9RHOO|nr:septal ring lytic transglycosylase RlpA family protein [Denitromonas ohlonensis]TVO67640.1 septal ring lytic transglycosylase RlpA family protein [Denitromonas ohlonensis]TVO76498.1 septal ring lytic transglycosylase RlpA family protein [Denitromonas ohlonensis]
MRLLSARLLLMCLAATLAACSSAPTSKGGGAVPGAIPDLPRRGGGYYKDDGPGDNVPADLHTIPDAVPRDEPVHRASTRPYTVFGKDYAPMAVRDDFRERGRASWYGRKFHGKKTSIGETYDMYAMTGAHKTLPLPSYVRVTNVANGNSVVVRLNDRGPFHSGRIIDLSYAAAYKLGYLGQGSAEVEIETVGPDDAPVLRAAEPTPPVHVAAAAPVASATEVASSPSVDPAAILNGAHVTALPSTDEGVYLQLGAFQTRDNAEGFRGHVAAELDWLRERLSVLDHDGRFRLQAGPYASAAVARAVAARIADALDVQPFLVSR